jgi:hypothetical protein
MRRIIASCGVLALFALLAGGWAADPKDKTTPKPKVETKESLVARLLRRVDFRGYEDPRMTLNDALDDLSKKYGVSFVLNEQAFKYDGLMEVGRTEIAQPTPIPALKNVRLDTLLRRILDRIPAPSGATFMVRREAIEITTFTFLRGEVWYDDPEGLHVPVVQVVADKQPFDELVRSLAEQSNLNILLDARAGETLKTPLSAELYNVPVDTALRALAAMLELRPVRMDNILFVTRAETAEAIEKATPKKPQRNVNYTEMISVTSGTLIRIPEP